MHVNPFLLTEQKNSIWSHQFFFFWKHDAALQRLFVVSCMGVISRTQLYHQINGSLFTESSQKKIKLSTEMNNLCTKHTTPRVTVKMGQQNVATQILWPCVMFRMQDDQIHDEQSSWINVAILVWREESSSHWSETDSGRKRLQRSWSQNRKLS